MKIYATRDIFWPVEKLPDDVFEGAILEIDIRVSYEQTENAEKRVRSLIDKLRAKTKDIEDK